MKFAIINASGSQYLVEEGKEILVDRLENNAGDTISFDVMLCAENDTVKVGTPLVKDCKVQAKVVNHERGNKLRVSRFTAKSRVRRVRGYRHDYTRLQILTIT